MIVGRERVPLKPHLKTEMSAYALWQRTTKQILPPTGKEFLEVTRSFCLVFPGKMAYVIIFTESYTFFFQS